MMPSDNQMAEQNTLLAFISSGLVNRGIGVESRGAGLHEFGRVVGGDGAQGAGGSAVCYAGHDGHDFSYLLF